MFSLCLVFIYTFKFYSSICCIFSYLNYLNLLLGVAPEASRAFVTSFYAGLAGGALQSDETLECKGTYSLLILVNCILNVHRCFLILM